MYSDDVEKYRYKILEATISAINNEREKEGFGRYTSQ